MAEEKYSGVIHICVHCSTPCSGKYCPYCTTADKRREMDAANDKLMMETNGKHFVCKVCEKEKADREKLAQKTQV